MMIIISGTSHDHRWGMKVAIPGPTTYVIQHWIRETLYLSPLIYGLENVEMVKLTEGNGLQRWPPAEQKKVITAHPTFL